MTCTITNYNNIRNLFFQCSAATLDRFDIPDLYRATIDDITYLIIPVDATEYTRTLSDKSEITHGYNSPFVTPKLVMVGFQARVVNNLWCIRQCLEFLAISSISTAYSNAITPVTVIDYCRPEITDTTHTVRKGLLYITGGTGTSGSDVDGKPLYTNEYDIEFKELTKRLVM